MMVTGFYLRMLRSIWTCCLRETLFTNLFQVSGTMLVDSGWYMSQAQWFKSQAQWLIVSRFINIQGNCFFWITFFLNKQMLRHLFSLDCLSNFVLLSL